MALVELGRPVQRHLRPDRREVRPERGAAQPAVRLLQRVGASARATRPSGRRRPAARRRRRCRGPPRPSRPAARTAPSTSAGDVVAQRPAAASRPGTPTTSCSGWSSLSSRSRAALVCSVDAPARASTCRPCRSRGSVMSHAPCGGGSRRTGRRPRCRRRRTPRRPARASAAARPRAGATRSTWPTAYCGSAAAPAGHPWRRNGAGSGAPRIGRGRPCASATSVVVVDAAAPRSSPYRPSEARRSTGAVRRWCGPLRR